MKFGLKNNIIQEVQAVFSQYPEVDAAIIYGSRAKGNFRPGSDIDITLKGEKVNLKILNSIALQLDDLLLPYIFDLSVFSHIKNPELIDHINRVGKVFYEATRPLYPQATTVA
ncbi:MAG: nucleotidyltransferase domain-containing protein [Lewinellaceae bacterium]|nr:nucleotidyltransferase domain-containing protein [Saprospiraceae bacterium]MCB9337788.1 nucleotidyltransferase domain-containing protein [Lewinellaceae bacterium]